jgi:VWFA-related protein
MRFGRKQVFALMAFIALLFTSGLDRLSGQARGGLSQDQRPGPPGTIRVHVRLIPVNVVVTDRQDRPVTDLKQDEFQVFENGQRQDIGHFSVQTFAGDALPLPPRSSLQNVPTPDLVPQISRTFLIMMGRGRHQTALRAVDALIRFVRHSLLPRDRVAVFAYNSATDFTTDHERIAQVLERYKKSNEKIESWLELRMRGLATIYGIRDVPKSMQPEIDKVFGHNGPITSRQVPPGRLTEKGTIVRDWDHVSDVYVRDSDRAAEADARRAVADEVAEEGGPGSQVMQSMIRFDTIGVEFATLSLPFDEFAPLAAGSFQDLQNLFTCIEYLRYMDGEKHLLFVTGDGLIFPNGNVEYDKGIIAMANDARVAIHSIQTSGTFADPEIVPTKGVTLPPATRGSTTSVAPPPPELSPANWSRTFMLTSLQSVSETTGGRVVISDNIDRALDRIDRSTRAQYLLGYYPKDARWNGQYRNISVKVNRPGLAVRYRHGYYARDTLRPYDREEFLAFSRISAAGGYEGEVPDVSFEVTAAKEGGVNPQVRISLQIHPEKIGFKMVDLRHVTRLHIAIFYADGDGNNLGDNWKTLSLELPEDRYQQAMKSGVPYSAIIPMKAPSQLVKVIVYDAVNDRVGTKLLKVK